MSKLNDILIIDDEKDICEQIVGLLNDKGYETKSALTSEDGISAFKTKNYSLDFIISTGKSFTSNGGPSPKEKQKINNKFNHPYHKY